MCKTKCFKNDSKCDICHKGLINQIKQGSAQLMTFSLPTLSSLSLSLPTYLSWMQCSGSPTRYAWLTSAPCEATWLSSSASSRPPCRNTSVWYPGRRTPSPSSQVGLLGPWLGLGWGEAEDVVDIMGISGCGWRACSMCLCVCVC